jgi:hypothetical protein
MHGTVRRNDSMTIQFRLRNKCGCRLHLSAVCCTQDDTRILHLSHYDSQGCDPGVFQGEAVVTFRTRSDEGGPPIHVEDAADMPRPFRFDQQQGLVVLPGRWSRVVPNP